MDLLPDPALHRGAEDRLPGAARERMHFRRLVDGKFAAIAVQFSEVFLWTGPGASGSPTAMGEDARVDLVPVGSVRVCCCVRDRSRDILPLRVPAASGPRGTPCWNCCPGCPTVDWIVPLANRWPARTGALGTAP